MAKCNSCGTNVEDDVVYCPNCGAKIQGEQQQPSNEVKRDYTDFTQYTDRLSSLNNTLDITGEFDPVDIQSNKGMAILSYLSWLLIIPLLTAKESRYARFHVNQGLCLAIAGTTISILTKILNGIPVIGTIWGIIAGILGIVLFVLEILGIINAAKGQAKELPVVGIFKIIKY